ncbi:MAG: methyltransferase domain-containing protein [Betaproteobacteria bacterium]|nr:methyltransferase domain-containing protein [Betaproteobacteria bacterium]
MDKDRVKAFTNKVFGDMAGAMSAGLGYVGVKTGLFRAMAGKGALTPAQVASAAGLQPRYVEEWLRGMASAGYLEHDPATDSYRLPDEHAFMVASDETDHFMGGLFCMVPVLMRVAPRVAEAFRTGGGVPFEEYGRDGIEALDLLNRGQYEQRFASHWLKSLPEATARLQAGASALDFGCGAGAVVLALARAFPRSRFTGIDRSGESVAAAERALAAAADSAELALRVRFAAQALADFPAGEQFDFITACDCIHDLAAPVETLRQIRARLKPGGVLMVIEPKAANTVEGNAHAIGTMYYGFSVFHCMTQSLAQGGPGLGTCMGPAHIGELMREAGFGRTEPLDIRSNVLSFYAVRH